MNLSTTARPEPRRLRWLRNANLVSLLVEIGAVDRRAHLKALRVASDRGRPLGTMERWPEEDLWPLYEKARSRWRMKVKDTHPDRGGNPDDFVFLNALWSRIRLLFNRRGVGV